MLKKTINFFSIITIVIGVIFFANGLIFAWTTPTAPPPDGNVSFDSRYIGDTTFHQAGGDLDMNYNDIVNADELSTSFISSSDNYFNDIDVLDYIDMNDNDIVSVNELGIGTDEPQAELHVQSNADDWTSLRIENTESSNSIWEFRNMQRNVSDSDGFHDTNNGFSLWGGENSRKDYAFFVRPDNQRMGIGTLSPQGKLDVHGSIYYYSSRVHSDARWKKDIAPLNDSLDKVLNLQGVSYKWKQDEFPDMEFDNKKHIGFIAQDLEKSVPEVVSSGENGYKYVSYENLNALLVEAVKEQQKMIKEQNLKIKELEKKISDM